MEFTLLKNLLIQKIFGVINYFKDAIDIISNIHKKGLIHRDIKPENLMLDKEGKLNFIDFGISKLIISNGIHISEKEGKSLIGTAKYCSVNSHKGLELSRRDDIESLIYTFAFSRSFKKFALFYEFFGTESNNVSEINWDIGITYELYKNIQIDFEKGKGFKYCLNYYVDLENAVSRSCFPLVDQC